MTRFLSCEVLLAAVLALTGCASWRGYGHDEGHTSWQRHEFVLDTSSASTLDFQPPSATRWEFVASDAFTASPAVFDNTVYIGSLNGTFYAIWASGPAAGTIRWQYPPVTAPVPPDACGTTVAPLLIASGSGNPSGPGIASSAAIAEDVAHHEWAVIFGAPDPNSNQGDGRLWALDAKSGQCIWKSQVIAPTVGSSKIGYSSPTISHRRAFVGVSAKNPDNPITIGRVFAIDLATGAVDAAFGAPDFGVVSSDPPAGGGVWSSPAVAPDGSVVVTTGNSCHASLPDCSSSLPAVDRTLSMVKLDRHTGSPIWQAQPVDINWDFDPDWAASPSVARTSCGVLSLAVQKDGWLHALDVGGMTPSSDPACSYPGHNLKCPAWTFPSVASLPFQDDGHGDNMDTSFHRLIHPGALAGDHYYVATGGLDVAANAPNPFTHSRFIVTGRLYKLDVCADDAHRIHWILDKSTLNQAFGSPSVANGVVYVGTLSGDFYAVDAHTDPTHRAGVICSYPTVPPGPMCAAGNFRDVDVPNVLRHLTLTGQIPGIPAVVKGQVFVATTAGHLYALAP